MACRDGCGCPQEARDARTDEWVGAGTPPSASTGRPVARLQAEKAPVEVQGPVRRSEAVPRCGYQIIDRDGDEAPCDEPATGWRWYQDVGEHEDLLDVACEFHRNEGGDRMHGLMQQVQTLRADLRHIAELLGEDPDDVPEGLPRLVDHLALRVGYLRGRDAGFDDVEAERDALAAKLARVEALAASGVAAEAQAVEELEAENEALRSKITLIREYAVMREAYGKRGRSVHSSRVASDLLAMLADPDGGGRG